MQEYLRFTYIFVHLALHRNVADRLKEVLFCRLSFVTPFEAIPPQPR